MTSGVRKIRWGVIGCARIAREAVIPAIQRSGNSVFHAIASRDGARAEGCRAKFGCPQAYRSYDDLLRDPQVDAVYIPLPNAQHREWTLKAAEQGKHVLCEKPIALSAAECSEMMAVCASRGVTLMEAFMYRYTDTTRKVLDVLRSGVLGEVRQINATFRFLLSNPVSIKLKPELGGGALYDVGCYPVNFAGMVVDELARLAAGGSSRAPMARGLPESVSVECVREGGVDVLFSALLRYSPGLIASLHCGFNAQKQIEAQIIGTKGVLNVPNTFQGDARAMTICVDGVVQSTISVDESDRYRLQVEDFADAVLHRRAPLLGLDETLRNMELINWLLAASR